MGHRDPDDQPKAIDVVAVFPTRPAQLRPDCRFGPAARDAVARYIQARMRQAARLFAPRRCNPTAEDPMTIEPEEILASRVLAEPAA